mmetsp:Transcript_53521/g.113668  ORF Transcript_53521/g.113668 Transcript_53521/m.113668 type:complete len:203 (+) Transcript_53521:249-857(+)
MTNIVSALRTVCSRCAITIVVIPSRFWNSSFSASWTAASDSGSRALVASSRRSRVGLLTRARAIAILCFWPPLSDCPRSPTCSLYFFGKLSIKLCALATLATITISSNVADVPYPIFSSTVPEKSTGSWVTSPIFSLCVFKFIFFRSVSPNLIVPSLGSYSRSRRDTIVDFPQPEWPTKATKLPLFIWSDVRSNAKVSGLVG